MKFNYINKNQISNNSFFIVTLIKTNAYNTKTKLCLINYNSDIIIHKLESNNKKIYYLLTNINNVFLFKNAKQTIRILLNNKLDVARPICIKTLLKLSGYECNNYVMEYAHSIKEAKQQTKTIYKYFIKLLYKIETLGLLYIAQIECWLTRVFASMEYIGIPFLLSKWKTTINNIKTIYAYKSIKQTQNELQASLFYTSTTNEKQFIYNYLNKNIDTNKVTDSIKNNRIYLDQKLLNIINKYDKQFLSFCTKKRIYGKFQSLGTSTGRVSSYNPNLQNLPSSIHFRKCIQAPINKILISADYDSCELRILAGLSQDSILIEAFKRNIDIHSSIANKLFKIPVNKTNNQHLRKKAKLICFSIIYGISINSLSKILKIKINEAKLIYSNFFKYFPKIKQYLNNTFKSCNNIKNISSILGRKLNINSKTNNFRNIYTISRNMPIQGTAADIIKLAMLRIHERLIKEFKHAYLINMIHDELVIECLKKDDIDIASLLKTEMENSHNFIIPNVKSYVNITINKYWK